MDRVRSLHSRISIFIYLSHSVAARFVCVCFFWGEYKCRYNLLQRLREACVHTDLAPVYAVAVAVASCFGIRVGALLSTVSLCTLWTYRNRFSKRQSVVFHAVSSKYRRQARPCQLQLDGTAACTDSDGNHTYAIYKEGFYFTCLSIRSLASISFFVGIHICFSKMANQTTAFRSFLFWAGYPHCAVLWLSSFIVAKK